MDLTPITDDALNYARDPQPIGRRMVAKYDPRFGRTVREIQEMPSNPEARDLQSWLEAFAGGIARMISEHGHKDPELAYLRSRHGAQRVRDLEDVAYNMAVGISDRFALGLQSGTPTIDVAAVEEMASLVQSLYDAAAGNVGESSHVGVINATTGQPASEMPENWRQGLEGLRRIRDAIDEFFAGR